jgi:voltage-gated potassium channel
LKSLALVLSYLSGPLRQRNLRVVLWLVLALVLMVAVFSSVFHVLMAAEGREYSWATGFYWTLTVMSTLGFGDITFESDAGRLFSIVVLVTGALFILVLLPFTFIQFVFMPWMAHREAARAPRKLPPDTNGHIVLAGQGAVVEALIVRADRSNVPYVLVVPDLDEALQLHDRGYRVMVGDLDDPVTYLAAQVEQASLVATTRSDTANTNIAFTIREIDDQVPIVATAAKAASVDILELAGCDEVLELGDMLGRALARRVLGADSRSHVIGEFGSLLIAEASAADTSLAGKTLVEADLRRRFNVNAVGVWQRGSFQLTGPTTRITPTTTLILAGSREQLDAYDAAYATARSLEHPVVIIGGGRVGRAASRKLVAAGIEHRIIERLPERVRDPERYVAGDAAELEVLHQAGIQRASAVLVTTHDDDVNVYLTIYCRKLRPDIQIIGRANLDRNVSTLHRAGADAVLSYASTGATAIWNTLGLNSTLVLAEGLDVIRVPMPPALAGKTLAESGIRAETGCNVVAVARGEHMESNPDAALPLPADADLIVIGDSESERRFMARYRPAWRPLRPDRHRRQQVDDLDEYD